MNVSDEYARLSRLRQRQREAHGWLASRGIDTGLEFDVRRAAGNPFVVLPREARFHDLVVAACAASAGAADFVPSSSAAWTDGETSPAPRDLVGLALAGARPLLVVRDRSARPSRGLLIYDGSSESARAIRSFLQKQLWPDMELRLLTVAPDEAQCRARQREFFDACRRDGREFEVGFLCGTLRRALVPCVEKWEPDLVVLGLGRSGSLRRRIFGDPACDVLLRTGCALYVE
jgi:hypothetical protein